MPLPDLIERCWRNGQSISETRSIARNAGYSLSFEDVRRIFAALSWRYG